ncbi:hypothetical protein [Campylobacter sp. CCUG 57310]|nr:hypothetical protein [Campylobacter sp. CCUG 57310]
MISSKKHFGKDIKNSEFWLECINSALGYAEEFKMLDKSKI